MNGILGSIDNIKNKTGDHGNEIYIEDSNLFFIKYGASHYIGISENGEKKYLGDYRSVRRIYKYRYNDEFFVCLEAPNLERLKKKDHRTLLDGINIDKNYHIVHPRSRSVISVDRLPDQISGDTIGNIVFADVDQSSRFDGEDSQCLTIFDKNSSSFIRDRTQLEPASEDEMEEFEEADKMRNLIDEMDDKDIIIDKEDIFDAVPNKDLREAHNDETLEQYIEKMFTSSPLDKEDIKTIIPGFGKSFNDSRPITDLREKHLEFMKSDEYRKILEYSKKVMESNGKNTEEVEKLQQISRDIKEIESTSSVEYSEFDIRDLENLRQFSNEIREAKESIEESKDDTNEEKEKNTFI